MKNFLTTVIKILENREYNFTVEDFLDAVWLAPLLPHLDRDAEGEPGIDSLFNATADKKKEQIITKKEVFRESILSYKAYGAEGAIPGETELFLPHPGSEEDPDFEGKYLRVPAAPVLSDTLALARALRPFMRRVPSKIHYSIDEEKTAGRIAEEGIWTPTLVPAMERWFSVELIVDAGVSMNVWDGIGYELMSLLRWLGAFRNIRTWSLSTDGEQPRLYAGLHHPRESSRDRSPKELSSTDGRKLVLVLSDCVSPAWHTGAITQFLNLWVPKGPVAIIQVFPFHLWARTALNALDSLYFLSSPPASPNTRLSFESSDSLSEFDNGDKTGDVPVPVVSLDPVSMADWSKLVTGTGGVEVQGCNFKREFPELPFEKLQTAPKLSPERCMELFLLFASPTAVRLALLISASPSISLQVIRIIRKVMLPEATHVHEAEVLLGGLLKPLKSIDENNIRPEDIQYEFRGDIRWKLLENVPIRGTIAVLNVFSYYVKEHLGDVRSFRVALAAPSKSEGSISIGDNPVARIACEILLSLGGAYARLVKKEKEPKVQIKGTTPEEEQHDGEKILKSNLKYIKKTIKKKIAFYEPLEFRQVYKKFIQIAPAELNGDVEACLDRLIKDFLVENAYFALGEKYIQRILMNKTGITDPHDIRLLETDDYVRERLEKDGLKRVKGFRESAKFKTFLTTAVVRLLYDSWRQKRRIEENMTRYGPEFDALFEAPVDDPLNRLIKLEDQNLKSKVAELLPRLLDKLDFKEELAIKMKYVKGMKISQIARTLDSTRYKTEQLIKQTERRIHKYILSKIKEGKDKTL